MYLLVLQHILVVARGALFLWREGSLAVVCRLSCPLAHGLLVSQPWIKPASPALEGRFNHWATREVPDSPSGETSRTAVTLDKGLTLLVKVSQGDLALTNYLGNNSTSKSGHILRH